MYDCGRAYIGGYRLLFVKYQPAAKKKKMKDKKMRLSYLIFPYLDNTDMFICLCSEGRNDLTKMTFEKKKLEYARNEIKVFLQIENLLNIQWDFRRIPETEHQYRGTGSSQQKSLIFPYIQFNSVLPPTTTTPDGLFECHSNER